MTFCPINTSGAANLFALAGIAAVVLGRRRSAGKR